MLPAILVLIGFTAVVAQVVFFRELMVVFQGNEVSLGLMLAGWLVWTAAGAALGGRMRLRNLNVLLALALPATVAAIRASKGLFESAPGELLGPGAMLATSAVALSVFCLASGALFSSGSRAWSHQTGAAVGKATATVYLLEAIGSGAGGLLASLVLLRWLDSFQIALALAALNLAAAAGRRRRALAVLIAGVPLALLLGPRWEAASLARFWHGFKLVATRSSLYGALAVVETEGSRTLYQNGLALFTTPDPAAAEEAVHYALLEHPAPRSLLLIGGGANGSVEQALQHRSLERVDYVELDPAILSLAPVAADPRVHVHHADGRLYLKTSPAAFDVIVVNVPDPQTAQLNRFYTLEFFREAARKLNPGGVLSLKLSASENYLSPELAALLRSIYATLHAVLPEIALLPGDTVHFFAAARAGVLAPDAQALLARLRARGLDTRYVREYYLPFRMTRVKELESQLRPLHDTPLNRDFAPVAYYFDIALWTGRFGTTWREAFQALARIPFAAVAAGWAVVLAALGAASRTPRAAAGFCAAAMGFTMIGLQMLLLLGFQAVHGYVYHQLALLIAAFMVGMALGSYRAARSGGSLALLQACAAAAPLLLYLAFGAAPLVFPALALGCGFLGGYQFPLASRVFFPDAAEASPGTLYALDLAGACLGAVLFSTYLVPVFGFLKTSLLIAAANVAPALCARGTPPR